MVTHEIRDYDGEATGAVVQLPESVAEVRAVLDTLPETDQINMWASESCLGARVIEFYNSGIERINFGYTSVDVTIDGRRFYNIELPGQARELFAWLFHEGGIQRHGTETETTLVHHDAYACPCGNPDCGANNDAYDEEETESRVTVGSLCAALDVFVKRDADATDAAHVLPISGI